jgi:hypothetical protein
MVKYLKFDTLKIFYVRLTGYKIFIFILMLRAG